MSGKLTALVVYESMYGNTHTIAEAIAAGLGTATEVELLEVGEAPDQPPARVGGAWCGQVAP